MTEAVTRTVPWIRRMHWGEWISTYSPVLLMGALALTTLWLVKRAPKVQEAPVAASVRHVVDYELRQFSMQTFGRERRQAFLEGEVMRHYADNDQIEIDGVMVLVRNEDGSGYRVASDHGLSNRDGSRVELRGHVRLVQLSPDGQPLAQGWTVETDYMLVDHQSGRTWTDSPVVMSNQAVRIEAMGFEHHPQEQQLFLQGPSRITRQGR